MSHRADHYEHSTTADSIKDLSDKLTSDVRMHIKSLGSHKPMSPEWIDMAAHLDKIATISEMEEKLPKKKEDATLWECEELVLRYLLEDGKLNLCLRSLTNYYEFRLTFDEKDIKPDARETMDKFERGLGLLLRNAFKHVEALQTTDIRVLVDHMSKVLKVTAKSEPSKPFGDMQPALILHYFSSLAKMLDRIGETKVFEAFEDFAILAGVAHHLSVFHKCLEPKDLEMTARAFSIFVGSEDFSTHKAKHVEGSEAKRDLLSWREKFLEDLIDEYEVKKAVRPLLGLL